MRVLYIYCWFALGIAAGLWLANALFVPSGDNRAYFMGAGFAFSSFVISLGAFVASHVKKRRNRR